MFQILPLVADRELMATLSPSAIQNLSAVLRRHPCSKTVRVLPLSDVWLKRSLHCPAPRLSVFFFRNLLYKIFPAETTIVAAPKHLQQVPQEEGSRCEVAFL